MKKLCMLPLVLAVLAALWTSPIASACPTGVGGVAAPGSTVCAESSSGTLYCDTADAAGDFWIAGGAVPPSTGGCLPTHGTYWFYQTDCYDDGMSVNRDIASEQYGGPWLDVTCDPADPEPVHEPRLCLLGTDWEWTPGHVTTLWNVSGSTGAVSTPRSTGLGHVIGLAMHPSNTRLYAVTSAIGTPAANSLYEINEATGASTFIGSLDIGTIFEGDLGFADNGTLYGIMDDLLYTIDTTTGAATPIGNPNGSDYSYLSFNGSNSLFAIDNGSTPGLVPTYLDRLNQATASVITSQTLDPELGGYGGMDWYQVGSWMWVADGQDPGSSYAGHRKLFRLNPSSGALIEVGPLGLSHGLTGLAACKPCAVETALEAEEALPQKPSLRRTLEMAYRVRDELLSATRVGKHYIDTFYDHSLRMAYLMVMDQSLRLEASSFLQTMTPGFLDLLDQGGQREKVNSQMVAAARSLADRFAAADNGGDLADAIAEELDRVDLDRLRGLSFADAWAYLNTLPTGGSGSQR